MSPGLEERVHALLRRQSSDEHRVPPSARTRARIGVGEVGFDCDLVCGQAPFDELVSTEFGESDINVDLLLPGTQHSMRLEQRRGDSIGGAVVTVYFGSNARPGNPFFEA